MKRDTIFQSMATSPESFEFDAEVAQVFDDMMLRSVPFYAEQQRMIREIGRRFYIPGTTVYDLGCSTATTLLNLASSLGSSVRCVGYDSSMPMLAKARRKVEAAGYAAQIQLCEADLNGPLSALCLENAGLVTLCWTLQFVRPPKRDDLVKHVYRRLVDGGALVVTEKVVAAETDIERCFVDSYYAFKSRNGYSKDEILRKKKALANILLPLPIEENLAMFQRNGFKIVETFFQWYNFAGFLCIKKSC